MEKIDLITVMYNFIDKIAFLNVEGRRM